jgi:hypothetical protein
MEIYRISASAVPAPQPVDKAVELDTIQSIYDACLEPEFDPETVDFANFGKLTSWVALQLSLESVDAAKRSERIVATKLGIAGLEVARTVGGMRQFYDNLLDCAHVYLIFNEHEDAAEVLNTVINSPDTDADHARPGAHVTLSSIYRLRSEADPDPRWLSDALYHLERGLRYIHSSVTDEERRVLLAGFVKLYARAGDIPGLVHCARSLGKPEAAQKVLDLVKPGVSINRIISLVGRLRALDEHGMADQIFSLWEKQQSSNIKSDQNGDE